MTEFPVKPALAILENIKTLQEQEIYLVLLILLNLSGSRIFGLKAQAVILYPNDSGLFYNLCYFSAF